MNLILSCVFMIMQNVFDTSKDFLCLCPRWYHGSICQRNTELFRFTLETLLTNDLYSSSMVGYSTSLFQVCDYLWI